MLAEAFDTRTDICFSIFCHSVTSFAASGKMQALYGAAQYSIAVSSHIANSQRDLQTLIDILQGKVGSILTLLSGQC
jgi:hypothetical protein